MFIHANPSRERQGREGGGDKPIVRERIELQFRHELSKLVAYSLRDPSTQHKSPNLAN